MMISSFVTTIQQYHFDFLVHFNHFLVTVDTHNYPFLWFDLINSKQKLLTKIYKLYAQKNVTLLFRFNSIPFHSHRWNTNHIIYIVIVYAILAGIFFIYLLKMVWQNQIYLNAPIFRFFFPITIVALFQSISLYLSINEQWTLFSWIFFLLFRVKI